MKALTTATCVALLAIFGIAWYIHDHANRVCVNVSVAQAGQWRGECLEWRVKR